ncbi:hypothetical protein YC2023_054298 [Brassica napus]
MHQTVIENRGLRFSTLLAGFSMEFNPFHYHVSKVIDLDAVKSFENGEGVRLIAPQDACKLQPFSQVYSHGNID